MLFTTINQPLLGDKRLRRGQKHINKRKVTSPNSPIRKYNMEHHAFITEKKTKIKKLQKRIPET